MNINKGSNHFLMVGEIVQIIKKEKGLVNFVLANEDISFMVIAQDVGYVERQRVKAQGKLKFFPDKNATFLLSTEVDVLENPNATVDEVFDEMKNFITQNRLNIFSTNPKKEEDKPLSEWNIAPDTSEQPLPQSQPEHGPAVVEPMVQQPMSPPPVYHNVQQPTPEPVQNQYSPENHGHNAPPVQQNQTVQQEPFVQPQIHQQQNTVAAISPLYQSHMTSAIPPEDVPLFPQREEPEQPIQEQKRTRFTVNDFQG